MYKSQKGNLTIRFYTALAFSCGAREKRKDINNCPLSIIDICLNQRRFTSVKVVCVGNNFGPVLHVLFIDFLGFLHPFGGQGTDMFVIFLLTHVSDDGLF